MYRVVDTNVLIVANNDSPQASPECVISCTNLLRNLQISGILVLDDRWLIISEYRNKVSSTGQPGVGDAFLKWVLVNQANPKHCDRVSITPTGENEFVEFPTPACVSRTWYQNRLYLS